MSLPSAEKFNLFLSTSKSQFEDFLESRITNTALHIVTGNEAFDLDSTVSSLLLAKLYSETSCSQFVCIPFFTLKRVDWALRSDLVYLFNLLHIKVQNIIFLDDFDQHKLHVRLEHLCLMFFFAKILKSCLERLKLENRLCISLTDHNKPSGCFSNYESCLISIIDHHVPDIHSSLIPPNCFIDIDCSVGSCCTLIAQRYLGIKSLGSIKIKNSELFAAMSPICCYLLISAIVLDTTRPDVRQGRMETDEYVLMQIVDHCRKFYCNLPLISRKSQLKLFEKLSNVKFDTSNLSTQQMLRKDFKRWESNSISYGISSVYISVNSWFEKDQNLVKNLIDFANGEDLELLICNLVVRSNHDQGVNKQLFAYSSNNTILRKVFCSSLLENLKLETIVSDGFVSSEYHERFMFFNQGDAKITRKIIQPEIKNILTSLN